jgi:hypothetical protein
LGVEKKPDSGSEIVNTRFGHSDLISIVSHSNNNEGKS